MHEHIRSIVEQNFVQSLSLGFVYSNCKTQSNLSTLVDGARVGVAPVLDMIVCAT